MPLVDCTEIWGSCDFIEGRPEVKEFKNVIYYPKTNGVPAFEIDKRWGIYDESRKLIMDAAYLRGANQVLVGQSEVAEDKEDIHDAPDGVYIYGGPIHSHFGHFIISTLARFWSINPGNGVKILCHSHQKPSDWFSRPFTKDIFESLGLRESDFVCFSQPTRVERLIVPGAAFEEHHFVHQEFATMCHRVGRKLTDGNADGGKAGPVYLSKGRLPSGVRKIVNEHEVCEFLENRGVSIVFPETLSLSGQISIFSKHSVVCGSLGSALHTSIFNKDPSVILGINHLRAVEANFVMIDKVNNNRSKYVFPSEEIYQIDGEEGFSMSLRLAYPHRIAENILQIMDEMA